MPAAPCTPFRAALAPAVLLVAATSAQAQAEWWPGDSLPANVGHGMAFDEARQRTVLFGGSVKGVVHGETWEWTRADWIRRTPAVAPSPRAGHVMAYDKLNGVTVLWGGRSLAAQFDETWLWNGVMWRQAQPAQRPPYLEGPVMAWCETRQSCILFGTTGPPAPAETWEWDGSNWTRLVTATSPPPAQSASLAFDSMSNRLLLVGGWVSGQWFFDGASASWTWGGPVPYGPRSGTAMVSDRRRNRVVLFGGVDGGSTAQSDTWEWDGTAWTAVVTPTAPPARRQAVAVYDPAVGMVLHGGGTLGLQESWADCWTFDGVGWTRVHKGQGPPVGGAPSGVLATYVPTTRTVFARTTTELDGNGNRENRDWSWDGWQWSEVTATSGPPGRWGAAMAFHAASGKVVLFGGRSNANQSLDDTWEWNGTAWRQLNPVNRPSIRYGAALSDDPARGVLVLHGGQTGTLPLRDTWEWDGTNWRQVSNTGPYVVSTMTYDFGRGVTVACSSDGTHFGVSEYDGRQWTQRPVPLAVNGVLVGAGLAYDERRGVCVLFGSTAGFGERQTWERTGLTWQLTSRGGPPVAVASTVVYDAARSRVMGFVAGPQYGTTPPGTYAGTWFYSPADLAPAEQTVPLGRTGTWTIRAPDSAGGFFVGAISARAAADEVLDLMPSGRAWCWPLAVDALHLVTIGMPGLAGGLGANGTATAMVPVPNDANLDGLALRLATLFVGGAAGLATSRDVRLIVGR